jgi:hypothetical protein
MLTDFQRHNQTRYPNQTRTFHREPGPRPDAFGGSGWRCALATLSLAALLGLLVAPRAAQPTWTPNPAQPMVSLQIQPTPNAQQPQPIPPPDNGTPPNLTPKQKQDLLKSGFAQMKKDTDQLLELAKSLQKEIDKGNENVLSVQVVGKAERIEKLAKKIKNTARGY